MIQQDWNNWRFYVNETNLAKLTSKDVEILDILQDLLPPMSKISNAFSDKDKISIWLDHGKKDAGIITSTEERELLNKLCDYFVA